jgi:hypothetical protein
MFWKFVVSALLLPACLGFETVPVFASSKVDILPHSENLAIGADNTNRKVQQDTLISDNEEGDTEEVEDTKDKHHYKRSRRQYRRQQKCPRTYHNRRRNYRRVNHRRYYNPHHGNYYHGNYYRRVNHRSYDHPYHPNYHHRNRYQRLRHGRNHH